MGRIALKNVTERKGLLYFRRKIGGKDTYIRLPAIDSPAFATEYARLSTPDVIRQQPTAGSMAALVQAYRGSVEFRTKAVKTRQNQTRYLDMIVTEHGHRSVSGVRPAHVYIMRDKLSETPGKANNWLSVFRSLMKYATRLDFRGDNPAADVPILPIGEHEPWPAELIAAALAHATPMTRLAIITGLCSGQRVGDCIRMQYGWISDKIMAFTQQKVRRDGSTKDVAIPMHPLWLDELARLPRKSVTLLYERSGSPFRTTGAIQERLRSLMAAEPVRTVYEGLVAEEIIPEGSSFTFHGLRKNACCYLLELGLNDSETGSILGMSPEMVRHYGKRTRALMIARGAAERVSGGKIIAMPGANKQRPRRQNG